MSGDPIQWYRSGVPESTLAREIGRPRPLVFVFMDMEGDQLAVATVRRTGQRLFGMSIPLWVKVCDEYVRNNGTRLPDSVQNVQKVTGATSIRLDDYDPCPPPHGPTDLPEPVEPLQLILLAPEPL